MMMNEEKALYYQTCNQTIYHEKPPDICIDNNMKLTQTGIISFTIYSILFVLSSVCNLTMFFYLCCNKRMEKSRMNKFMFHLNIADLLITFITIPIEAGWKLTVYWRAGNFGCRFFQFIRTIGNYLASFIVISLCIDRYYAIVHPLKFENTTKRTKILLSSSYILSILCSAPQIFVFSTKTHPIHKWYTQCLDYKFDANPFENPQLYRIYEITFLIYQIFVSFITFFLPLIVIVISYVCIILKIVGELNEKTVNHSKEQINSDNSNSTMLLSKNRNDTIKRAKKKTLKLAILIVIVFLISWTPYYAISVLFWIKPEYANKLDDRIYNFLFIFAVSNCLANPLVYGLTSFKFGLKSKNNPVNKNNHKLHRKQAASIKIRADLV